MKLDDITIGMNAIINKPKHRYDGHDGKVLSIYTDYKDSTVVSIRLLIEDDDASVIVGRLNTEDLSA